MCIKEKKYAIIIASSNFIEDILHGKMLEDFEDEVFSAPATDSNHDETERKLRFIDYLTSLTHNQNAAAWYTLSCHIHQAYQKTLETALCQTLDNVLGFKVILPTPVRRYKVYRSGHNANHIVIKYSFKYHRLADALMPRADEPTPSTCSMPPPKAQTPPEASAVEMFSDAKNLATYRENWRSAEITTSMQFIIDLNQPDRAVVSPFDLHLELP